MIPHTEAQFREWRRPENQRRMFPKAWQYGQQQRRLALLITCEVCGARVRVQDTHPDLVDVCIACAPTLW